jgi:hypothetical protein
MKIERLEELQQSINALRSINPEEGAALIGEIWRLRTAQTGKEFEVSYLKDGHDRLKAEVERMSEANRSYKRKTSSSRARMGCQSVISKTAGASAKCGCKKGAN